MSETKKPIRRPRSERWRDVRLRFVPLLVYLTGVIAALYIWNTHWAPSTFVGEVRASVSNVNSPLDGIVLDLQVREFDIVTQGQVLGKVAMPPAALSAGLMSIRTDLELLRAEMALDLQRNDQDFHQLRMNMLDQKVDLAIAQSRLRYAESELSRIEQLRSENVASQFEFEFALDNRDSLEAEIEERMKLIASMEESLSSLLSTVGTNEHQVVLDKIDDAIEAQEEEYRQISEAVLHAPIDGMVVRVFQQPGEAISAGSPLIVISSEHPEQIIGYIRQPMTFEPKIGDPVTVRSRRGNSISAGKTQILRIGARVDPLMQLENETGFDPFQPRGLAVMIDIPESLNLYPGELVDITLDL